MNDFKKRLIFNRWYVENTAGNYCRTLKLFDSYLKSISLWKRWINNPEAITLRDIEFFITSQRRLWKTATTCNNYLAGIKNYLKYNLIIWKEVIDYKRILTAREPQKKIESLTEQEAKNLIEYFKSVQCETHREELIKTRNFLICRLLIYTGLRVNELSNIKIKDVKEELQIIWKWGTRRVVYLFKDDLAIIDLYLFLRKDNCPYLIVSHSNNYETDKLSNVSIENIIRQWGKRIWIEVFPHKLRHTFATNLLRKGAKLPYIQQLLWHKNINTTQTYLSVLNTDIRDTQSLLKNFE